MWLNQELVTVLPLADFKKPGRFVRLISMSREIILQKTKRTFLQAHFKKRRRARDRSGLVLHLNRFSSTNLFQQAFTQLQRYGGEWINFRKPWKCVFDGEGGSDAGGPGRESVTVIMESVFTKAYHLFVSTPNDLDPSAGTNDRSCVKIGGCRLLDCSFDIEQSLRWSVSFLACPCVNSGLFQYG